MTESVRTLLRVRSLHNRLLVLPQLAKRSVQFQVLPIGAQIVAIHPGLHHFKPLQRMYGINRPTGIAKPDIRIQNSNVLCIGVAAYHVLNTNIQQTFLIECER